MTVLGQIDPGPAESRLVDRIHRTEVVATDYSPIPEPYWEAWRRETDLADIIVVNSGWARAGLLSENVPSSKISVLPLALEVADARIRDVTPSAFSHQRPLRLLFLGQVNLRKGIDILFEAMSRLHGLPVHLDVVGPIQLDIPEYVRKSEQIKFHGPVPRDAVHRFYNQADLFVFPTRSDGFGLTQLEALGAGVPIIASRYCGEVVRDTRNGILLPNLEPETLAGVLRELVYAPGTIAKWRQEARVDDRFSLEALGRGLLDLQHQRAMGGSTGDAAIND